MGNHTKNHTDTEAFSKVTPAVFQAILDVIPALGAVLNWEPLACVFLAEVLRQISLLGNPLTLGHAQFAAILWGKDITKIAAERRMGRCVQALTRCQAMSGCYAVWIERGWREEKEKGSGEYEYHRTAYQLRDFFVIFSEIQSLAVEQDLLSLPKGQRKQTQLAIVQNVCDARQYQRIPDRARQQRHFQTEAKAKAEPLPKAELIPSPIVSFAEYHAAFQERLYAELAKTPANSLEGQTFIDDVLKETRMTERRWRDLGRAKGVNR